MGTYLRHARELLTLASSLPPSAAEGPWDPSQLGLIADGAVLFDGDRVVAVGPTRDLDPLCVGLPALQVIEVGDRVVAPGLVDAHTHSLFVGSRADEYSLRVQGAGYAAIAARGGGIVRSVTALRDADDTTLRKALDRRLAEMLTHGTTTVEVKTGYALDARHELRCLDLLDAAGPWVVPTFLPLHAVPPEHRDHPDGRSRFLEAMMALTAQVARGGKARFVDAYVDTAGFSVDEARPLLQRAKALGLRARLHLGQFADIGGCELAAALGAASGDHLEHASDAGLRAMAEAGVTAVLLPGAAFSLGQPMPDARRMRALGVSVALATDMNPGTSHTASLPLMAAFGVRQMGLSTVEAWHALTRVPAQCLGLPDRGRIAVGSRADLVIYDLPGWEALPYDFGSPRAVRVWRGGEEIGLSGPGCT